MTENETYMVGGRTGIGKVIVNNKIHELLWKASELRCNEKDQHYKYGKKMLSSVMLGWKLNMHWKGWKENVVYKIYVCIRKNYAAMYHKLTTTIHLKIAMYICIQETYQ